MEVYRIEGSLTTPSVLMDPQSGLIEIRGKSIPENSYEFYAPLYEWLGGYMESPVKKTVVTLAMEYFNTSSSKEFMKFMDQLGSLYESGTTELTLKWIYEEDDEDMLEMGEALNRDVDIPMEIIAVEEL